MENNNLIGEEKNVQQKYIIRNDNRPESYYDNNISENRNMSLPRNYPSIECKFEETPTQTHCLNTTVPQNIAAQNIAGKHTPTRNSLRHSRMIVHNRSGKASGQDLPPIVKYYKFVKIVLVLITFLGTALCILSLLLLLWTPSLRSRDNPYWSAIPVIFSGIIGFLFLHFYPKEHPSTKFNYWINSIKFMSVATSLIAVVASFTACAFAVIHLIALTVMICLPPDIVSTTCMCSTNSTEVSVISSYHYVDLSCMEVNNHLYIIVVCTCIINAVVAASEVLYLYFHWSSRSSYIYSRVETNNYINKINRRNR